MTNLNERTFAQYRRKKIAELRPWKAGEDMGGISVSQEDSKAGSPKSGDMIARNPANHADQWLVASAYFADNFDPVRIPDDGGPAFPGSVRDSRKKLTREPGMSLRDWFAGKAMTAFYSSFDARDAMTTPSDLLADAKMFYDIADAMLEVRRMEDD